MPPPLPLPTWVPHHLAPAMPPRRLRSTAVSPATAAGPATSLSIPLESRLRGHKPPLLQPQNPNPNSEQEQELAGVHSRRRRLWKRESVLICFFVGFVTFSLSLLHICYFIFFFFRIFLVS